MRRALLILACVLLAGATASAQAAPDGAAVFQKACASCHAQPGPDSRAPTRPVLAQVAPRGDVNGRAPTLGGMRAVKIDSGQEVWSKPAAEKLCGTARGCSAAQGAAVTAVPGIVFSGSMDGGVRAYSSTDGSILWRFDTNTEFETVNGVTANGGAIDGPGPVVADGMLYVTSGYVRLIGRPGNVLLAFGVD
jgi:outer membrane protein assembly factor BamB